MNTIISILNTKTNIVNSGLFMVCLAGVCLYIFYVSAAVNEVVLRKDMVRQMTTVRSDIATLESAYIDAQHTVSKRIATAAEYQKADGKYFVSRSQPSLVLSAGAEN